MELVQYTTNFLDPVRHPLPSENEKLRKVKNIHQYYFGFSSLDQLKDWFYSYEVRKILDSYDYAISHYIASKGYVLGEQQLIFKKHKALLINYIDLLYL